VGERGPTLIVLHVPNISYKNQYLTLPPLLGTPVPWKRIVVIWSFTTLRPSTSPIFSYKINNLPTTLGSHPRYLLPIANSYVKSVTSLEVERDPYF